MPLIINGVTLIQLVIEYTQPTSLYQVTYGGLYIKHNGRRSTLDTDRVIETSNFHVVTLKRDDTVYPDCPHNIVADDYLNDPHVHLYIETTHRIESMRLAVKIDGSVLHVPVTKQIWHAQRERRRKRYPTYTFNISSDGTLQRYMNSFSITNYIDQ